MMSHDAYGTHTHTTQYTRVHYTTRHDTTTAIQTMARDDTKMCVWALGVYGRVSHFTHPRIKHVTHVHI